MKLPSMQFYTGDWLKDPSIRRLSPAARGLWFDMLCFMWESPRRGFLDGFPPFQSKNGLSLGAEESDNRQKIVNKSLINRQYIDDKSEIICPNFVKNGTEKRTNFGFRKVLGKLCGIGTKSVSKLLDELDDAEIFSVTQDGVIYNRRMVKDEAKRIVCTELGRKGGNPKLVNRETGQTVNPTLNRPDEERLTLPLTVSDEKTDKGWVKGSRARASSSSSSSQIKGSLSHSCDSGIPKTSEPAPAPKPEPAPVDEGSMQLAWTLKGLILANDQNAAVPADLTSWGKEAELLQRIDKRDASEILAVMKWSQADPFWRSNILSMKKLREKFTQLKLRMVEAKNRNATKLAGDAAPVAGKYSHLS